MNREQLLWKLQYLCSSAFSSFWESGKFTKVLKRNFRPSSTSETSLWKEFVKPHRFFQLGFLLLFLWAILPEEESPRSPIHNWKKVESPSCTTPEPGFYLAEGADSSVEFYTNQMDFFAPTALPPNPECVSITEPTRIEEI